MKQFKPALICIAVLVVLSLVAVLVMNLPEPTKPDDDKTLPITESVRIISFDSGKISSIEISDENGDFAIDYKKEEVGMSAVMRGADPRLVYDEFEMTSLPLFLCELSALEEIDASDALLFGFDSPRRKIKINLTDGESATLLIGDDLPVTEGVYVKKEGADEIYTVGKTTKERLLVERHAFLNYALFPRIEKVEEITEVEYTPYGKSPIKLSLRSEEDIQRDTERMGVQVKYELTSPVKALASPDTLESKLLEKIIAIEGARIVEESPKDLGKYGLDRADKLSFKTILGVSASILIGKDSETGGSFVMPENVPVVIETMSPIGLSGLKVSDITLKLLFFFNSTEVDSFDYVLADGSRHTLKLELEEHLVRGSLDGKKLEGRNAANLFQRTIRFSLAGEIEGEKSFSSPEITVTANLKNGKRETLKLYKINERQYAAEVSGKKADFYVPVAEVRDLKDAFEIIARGEEIPNMF